MNRESQIDSEFLGADTGVSPEVIDFLIAPNRAEKAEKPANLNATGLDEYEQAMVV
ncbi:hypothetical protein Q9L42_004430 [Methylomarinum sp. Ch1-1]|uniref:Uncharacterized protein n=1 Tax=Methylomarinum roseum TaxID=3067653 RepID=A0AAU7NWT1_9GAMM|nr:hypothetical protein [Methylomarinum sp. Ch1-1]MDP4522559.1 hypothetical protein [Methylomarinum sp. Ch1-1]